MATCKPKFSVGERVLCFEPDQSKARVLYDAKIIEVGFAKEGKTKKEPEYKIHFQGWNSTWDRWANENFVLKDSEDNRKLQRKLAKCAIKKLKSHGRKKVYLPGVASVIKKCSDPLSDTDSSSDDREAEDSDNFSTSDGEHHSPVKRRRKKSSTIHAKQSDEVTLTSDLGSIEDPHPSSSTSQSRRCPPLDIPSSLLARLEEDNIMMKKRSKLVDLPAKLSIVQILENYAKYFALHVAKLPSSEKPMKSGSQPTDFIPPEKNLNLAKETCQEVRVLFDFVLPVVLLYDFEQDQYKDLIKRVRINKSHQSDTPASPRFSPDNPGSPQSPKFKFSPPRVTDDTLNSQNVESKKIESPNPRKSMQSKHIESTPHQRHHKKSAEEQIIEETHTYLIPHQPNLDKTGLASDAQGRRRSSRLTHNLHSPASSDKDAMVSSSRTEDTSVKRVFLSIDTCLFLRAPSNHTHGVKSEKESKTPMPLLCRDDDRYSCFSSSISLNQMCQEVFVGSAGDDVKKALNLAQTWKFQLFPVDYEPPKGASVPLSLIYGIQHLLRLFVKIPLIFSKMNFPDFKLKIIYKHLQALIKFLSEYENDIFSRSSSYISA